MPRAKKTGERTILTFGPANNLRTKRRECACFCTVCSHSVQKDLNALEQWLEA